MFQLLSFKSVDDHRGSLVALEECNEVPFEIKRVYYIYGNTKNITRGYHAHKALKQVLICLAGSVKVKVDDGREKNTYELLSPDKGLLIEGLVWREMSHFSENCVLLVLADAVFDEDDYIRDYDNFIRKVNK